MCSYLLQNTFVCWQKNKDLPLLPAGPTLQRMSTKRGSTSQHRHDHAEDDEGQDTDESAGSNSTYHSDGNLVDEDDDDDMEKLLQMVNMKPPGTTT